MLETKLAGKPAAEIAQFINHSESTVFNRLARIREVLQTLGLSFPAEHGRIFRSTERPIK